MKNSTIKVLGVVATVIGAGATILGNWAGEKQQDAKIAEKVAEALEKAASKE